MKYLLLFACCLSAIFANADVVKMTPLETFVDGTNETLRAANAYTDAHSGGGGGGGAVQSVNGKTGVVELVAADVGALPNTYVPPAETDPTVAEWAKSGQPKPVGGVTSVNTKTGEVVLAASDVGAATPVQVQAVDIKADSALAQIAATRSMISATDPTFSNAVLSVATGISTNDWAVIASVADWASVLPGGVPGGAGTLGAVLAALAAAVLALKKKTSLLKSDGTAEDGFATNLLGKQVANVKANTASLAAAYSETETYAVGDAVTHEGKLYKCAVAISTAEAWTPAHWTETTVATLWNNADTTSYGGQN